MRAPTPGEAPARRPALPGRRRLRRVRDEPSTAAPATTAGATTTTAAASQACADAAALKASVAELDQIDLPDAGKAGIQAALEKVRTNLAALRTSAASQWGTEVGELGQRRQRPPDDRVRDRREQPAVRPADHRQRPGADRRRPGTPWSGGSTRTAAEPDDLPQRLSTYSSWRRIQSWNPSPSSRPLGARSRIG